MTFVRRCRGRDGAVRVRHEWPSFRSTSCNVVQNVPEFEPPRIQVALRSLPEFEVPSVDGVVL